MKTLNELFFAVIAPASVEVTSPKTNKLSTFYHLDNYLILVIIFPNCSFIDLF